MDLFLGSFILWIFGKLNIIKWEEDDKGIITCNNFTLINFVLIKIGPMRESTLTLILLLIQVRFLKDFCLEVINQYIVYMEYADTLNNY